MTGLLAADSWLVHDGRVCAVDRHWARFSATCREHGVEPQALAAFRARSSARGPSAGAGFRASSCARTASSPSSCARRRRASQPSWPGSPTCPIPEGEFTSLLWWESETLWAVPDDAPILPGITRGLLIELARECGTPVAQRRPAPQELAGRETWLVSALHGIRAVTRWANGGPRAGDAPRAATWQRLLDDFAARQAV